MGHCSPAFAAALSAKRHSTRRRASVHSLARLSGKRTQVPAFMVKLVRHLAASTKPPDVQVAIPEECIMFKLILAAGLVSLLAACSTMPGPSGGSGAMESSAAATASPRSPGEGPAFNPYYGAAGH
jgi:hypothetical protein